jgi:hypothetical protein
MNRYERRKLEVREKILTAAFELFLQHGIAATTIEEICEPWPTSSSVHSPGASSIGRSIRRFRSRPTCTISASRCLGC